MTIMKTKPVLILCLMLGIVLNATPSYAQKKLTKKAKLALLERHQLAYDSLYAAYEFQALKDMLLEDKELAESVKRTTEQQDSLLPLVDKALALLRSVEKVEFIDSVVVKREDFFKTYSLGSATGRIGKASQLLPRVKGVMPNSLAYLNDFGDVAYFSAIMADSVRLCKSQQIGGVWQSPVRLKFSEPINGEAGFPYLLSDGITLFFAAKGSDTFGGYDIYVTNYNAESGEYMKPENMGMPFNSPANDYLYVIDESRNIGWFATERGQEEGYVCIYKFIPSSLRQFYDPATTDNLQLLARYGFAVPAEGDALKKGRGKKLMADTNSVGYAASDFRFPINDAVVYTDPSQFVAPESKALFEEWQTLGTRIQELRNAAESLLRVSVDEKAKAEINKIEAEILECEARRAELAKQIRKAEAKFAQ